MTTEAKHTPGPWINCNTHVDDSRGVTLFRSTRDFNNLNPGDFRLAAAAPELLAACEAALNRCEEAKRVVVGRFIGDNELIDQLRAALAQAKGGA